MLNKKHAANQDLVEDSQSIRKKILEHHLITAVPPASYCVDVFSANMDLEAC